MVNTVQDKYSTVNPIYGTPPAQQSGLFLGRYQINFINAISDGGEILGTAPDAAFIARYLATHNLYFSVNRVRSAFSRQKAGKGDIAYIQALVVDLDPKSDKFLDYDHLLWSFFGLPEPKDKTSDLTRQQMWLLNGPVRKMFTSKGPPTIFWFSGRGFQAMWLLTEVIKVNDLKDIVEVENHGRALVQALDSDSVFNIDRIMRLPGTANQKTAAVSVVLCETGCKYTLKQMRKLWGYKEASSDKPEVDTQETNEALKSVHWGEVFSTESRLDLGPELMSSLHDIRMSDVAVDRGMAGDPLPGQKDSSRSGHDFAMAIALRNYRLPPQMLFQILMLNEGGKCQDAASKNDRRYFERIWTNMPKATAAEDDFKKDLEDVVVDIDKIVDASKDIADCWVISSQNKIYDKAADVWSVPQAFDRHHLLAYPGEKGGPPKATNALIKSGHRAKDVTWWPGQGQIVSGSLNLYRPPGWGVDKDRSWVDQYYERILRHVFRTNEEIEVFLDYCAFIAQFPELKPNHHLLLWSMMEGIGKDTVIRLFAVAAGLHNFVECEPDDIFRGFNDALAWKKMVHLAEVEAIAESKAMYKMLKRLLANPPAWIELNCKTRAKMRMPNLIAFVLSSNSPRALSLTKRSRRLAPVHCNEWEMKSEVAMWAQRLCHHKGAAVHGWLMERDVTRFDPGMRHDVPEMVAHRGEMIESAKSDTEILIEELFEAKEDMFEKDVVTTENVRDFCDRHRMKLSTFRLLVMDRGAVKIEGVVRYGAITKKVFLWVLHDVDKYTACKAGSTLRTPRPPHTMKSLEDLARGIV